MEKIESHRKYKSAARDLISYIYHHGYKVAIYDEWEGELIHFTTAKKAWEEVNAVDGGEDFYVVNSDVKAVSRVILAIGYNDPEEEVCDWGICQIVDDWHEQFYDRY